MKSTEIDRYLNEVCWAMGGSFSEQQTVRDELRAHMRDEICDLQYEGLDAREAVERALRDLGDAEELGRSLRSSRGTRPLRRPLTQPVGGLTFDRRAKYQQPDGRVLLALAMLALVSVAVPIAYLWPA